MDLWKNSTLTAKRDIAKAFGIRDAGRIELKRLLRELEDEGSLQKRHRSYRDAEKLPPVSILTVLPPDRNGDQWAKPMEWQGEGAEPRILFMPRAADAPVAEGDRILARLTEVNGQSYNYEALLDPQDRGQPDPAAGHLPCRGRGRADRAHR